MVAEQLPLSPVPLFRGEGKCEDKMATPILSSEGCVPVGTRLKSYKKSPCQKAEA